MWNSNINLRYLWCSQGKKVPLFHLFIWQVYLESNFGHISSIQNSLKNSKKRRRIWFVPYLLPNSTQIALIMPVALWHSIFTVYVLCNYCLRTSLPPVLILRVFVIDFPPCLNLIQHKNNIKPEFKTIYCIKLFLLFYFLSFFTTQTNCLKFRLRSNGISSLNIFFSSSIL